MEGRYRAKYEDQGVAVDVLQAVQALAPKSPLDFDKRVNAVNHFRTLPEAAALAAANKRVANILAKKQHQKVLSLKRTWLKMLKKHYLPSFKQ